MRVIAAAVVSALSLLSVANADHDCPLCPIMEWEHKDSTTGDIYYYYTYYCDFYSGDCDDIPDGCSELTGIYPWPCIACGSDCEGAQSAPVPPAAPAVAPTRTSAPTALPTVAKTSKPFPGLKNPVNAANPHKMPRRAGGNLARQIGPAKFVKVSIPGEATPRSALEYRYKIVSKHDGTGVERKDIWLAFETDDPPPMNYPTYTADMADPHGTHWHMIDTGDIFMGNPRLVLFLGQ